jgi:hypothetical protein
MGRVSQGHPKHALRCLGCEQHPDLIFVTISSTLHLTLVDGLAICFLDIDITQYAVLLTISLIPT